MMFETVGAMARFFDLFMIMAPLLIIAITVNIFFYWQKRKF